MKILVPIDFTTVTENALRYAISLPPCRVINLFHVAGNEKEIVPATGQLQILKNKYSSGFSGAINISVQVGNIFDQIGGEALKLQCDLIVMGTHGVKGMQHFLGSRAMKVITNSKTPYIVVQHKSYEPVKNILVPVDFTRESKQVLPVLVSLARMFGAVLHLMPQKTGKDEFVKNKIMNNLAYYKNVLDENQCAYTVLNHEFSFEKRYRDIMKEVSTLNPQLIVAAIDPKVDVADYMMGIEEQKIVANDAGIPVLCINIKHFTRFTGSIFEGSA